MILEVPSLFYVYKNVYKRPVSAQEEKESDLFSAGCSIFLHTWDENTSRHKVCLFFPPSFYLSVAPCYVLFQFIHIWPMFISPGSEKQSSSVEPLNQNAVVQMWPLNAHKSNEQA